MSRRRLSALTAALLLGCGGSLGAGPQGPSSEDQQEYAQALALLGADRAGGVDALEAFIEHHPRSYLADDASLRLAELATEDGRENDALQHLSWAIRHHPKGDRSDMARLEFAKLQRARGHPRAAYRTAKGIRLSMLGSEERREAHRLLADLAGEDGKVAAQLRWLSRVRADQPDEEAAARIDAEIEQLLATMGPDALEAAAAQLGKRVPAARLRLRQAELALRVGDVAAAEAAIARASALPLTDADVLRLTALEAALSGGVALQSGLLAGLPASTTSGSRPHRIRPPPPAPSVWCFL